MTNHEASTYIKRCTALLQSVVNAGGYICIGGSKYRAQLYSREGHFLGCAAQMSSSITAIAPHPSHDNTVAIVCIDGSVTLMQIQYDTAYDFHRERYAYKCVPHNILFDIQKRPGNMHECGDIKFYVRIIQKTQSAIMRN